MSYVSCAVELLQRWRATKRTLETLRLRLSHLQAIIARFTLFISLSLCWFYSHSHRFLCVSLLQPSTLSPSVSLSYSLGYIQPYWHGITRTLLSLNSPKPAPLSFFLSRPSSSHSPSRPSFTRAFRDVASSYSLKLMSFSPQFPSRLLFSLRFSFHSVGLFKKKMRDREGCPSFSLGLFSYLARIPRPLLPLVALPSILTYFVPPTSFHFSGKPLHICLAFTNVEKILSLVFFLKLARPRKHSLQKT